MKVLDRLVTAEDVVSLRLSHPYDSVEFIKENITGDGIRMSGILNLEKVPSEDRIRIITGLLPDEFSQRFAADCALEVIDFWDGMTCVKNYLKEPIPEDQRKVWTIINSAIIVLSAKGRDAVASGIAGYYANAAASYAAEAALHAASDPADAIPPSDLACLVSSLALKAVRTHALSENNDDSLAEYAVASFLCWQIDRLRDFILTSPEDTGEIQKPSESAGSSRIKRVVEIEARLSELLKERHRLFVELKSIVEEETGHG